MNTSDGDFALVRLGEELRASGYAFVTPTPATHALVNARCGSEAARSATDVFGWSRPFDERALAPALFSNACEAGVVEENGDRSIRSTVRFSTLGECIFVHSAFPTDGADAVFFGPDTYRFARLLAGVCGDWTLPTHVRVMDVGCGSGARGHCS